MNVKLSRQKNQATSIAQLVTVMHNDCTLYTFAILT